MTRMTITTRARSDSSLPLIDPRSQFSIAGLDSTLAPPGSRPCIGDIEVVGPAENLNAPTLDFALLGVSPSCPAGVMIMPPVIPTVTLQVGRSLSARLFEEMSFHERAFTISPLCFAHSPAGRHWPA